MFRNEDNSEDSVLSLTEARGQVQFCQKIIRKFIRKRRKSRSSRTGTSRESLEARGQVQFCQKLIAN